MKKIKAFFVGVKKEIKKTKWPKLKDLTIYSYVVICMMVFFSLFFYLLDVIFAFIKGLVN